MRKLMAILIGLGLVCSNSAFGDGNRWETEHDRWSPPPRHHFPQPTPRSTGRLGWDVSPWTADRAPNCHRYSLRASGGRGSARITSLPGKNYIQVSNGEKNGYVCFNGPTTLELGKLADHNVSVALQIEDVGTYYFEGGDLGEKRINNWLRAYWSL